MLAILLIVLAFGLIIGIHEATHMLLAKAYGVKVIKFAFGFGPRLLYKQIGETSYELRLLPLGGFVQFHGESPNKLVSRGFFSLSWWKRCIIAGAAPIVNIALGVAVSTLALYIFKDNTLLEAFRKGVAFNWMIISETLRVLFGFGATAVETIKQSDIGGPITIFKIMRDSVAAGPLQFAAVISLLSTSIGLFNLFPIPGLDGGHVFLYTLEGIWTKLTGRRFPAWVYNIWGLVGFVLLMGLMVFVIYCDIARMK